MIKCFDKNITIMNSTKLFLLPFFIFIIINATFSQNSKEQCAGVGIMIREKGKFVGYNSGGINGFFVRNTKEKSVYYDFNDSFKGCAIEGIIKDSIHNEVKQGYYFKIEGEFLIMSTSTSHDTFFVKNLNCNYLVLKTIKNSVQTGDTLRFIRIFNSPFDFDTCYRICSTNGNNSNQNSEFGVLMVIGYLLSGLFLAAYLGTFIMLIKHFFRPGFIMNTLYFWLPLTLLFTTIEFSTQINLFDNKIICFFCDIKKQSYFVFNFYNKEWTESGDISKASFKYWLITFLFNAPHTLVASAWLSWRKIFFHQRHELLITNKPWKSRRKFFRRKRENKVREQQLSNSSFSNNQKIFTGIPEEKTTAQLKIESIAQYDIHKEQQVYPSNSSMSISASSSNKSFFRWIKIFLSNIIVLFSILLAFLIPSLLFLQALSFGLAIAPHSWLFLLISYALFLFYFKQQIWTPFYKEDLLKVAKEDIHKALVFLKIR